MSCGINYTAHPAPKRVIKRGSPEMSGDMDP